jgi:hypothetical protein
VTIHWQHEKIERDRDGKEKSVTILHLPYPPSSNAVTRFGKRGVYSASCKKDFFAQADGLQQTLGPLPPMVEGPFTYHIVLNRKHRHHSADGDNRCKYVLDYAQRIQVIENDRLAEGGSWSWGTCEHGAMLSIHPVTK